MESIFTWFVCVWLNIYINCNVESVWGAKDVQCMGRRGARGRTGVFDGLTLVLHNTENQLDKESQIIILQKF